MPRMSEGCEPNTVSHGTQSWIVSNSSGLVEVPDEVGRWMLQDGRSGCVEVKPPEGKGELLSCPCCHFAWRRKDASDPEPESDDKS
jgi:hypothetical protein